jgi:hypothetical protein
LKNAERGKRGCLCPKNPFSEGERDEVTVPGQLVLIRRPPAFWSDHEDNHMMGLAWQRE